MRVLYHKIKVLAKNTTFYIVKISYFFFMRHIFIQACIRGMIFGMSFLLVFLGGLSMTTMFASENPGGRFGEILNSILASGNWQTDTTGKVRDSARLG